VRGPIVRNTGPGTVVVVGAAVVLVDRADTDAVVEEATTRDLGADAVVVGADGVVVGPNVVVVDARSGDDAARSLPVRTSGPASWSSLRELTATTTRSPATATVPMPTIQLRRPPTTAASRRASTACCEGYA
jgi:hypothetical protein